MARHNGRDVIIEIGGTPVAVVVSNSRTHNRESIDVTAKQDNGWRKLLPDVASRSIDEGIEGVCDDVNLPLLQGWFAGDTLIGSVTLVYGDGSTATAADGFFLAGFEVTGAQDGAATFSATLQSSGAVTITPAP